VYKRQFEKDDSLLMIEKEDLSQLEQVLTVDRKVIIGMPHDHFIGMDRAGIDHQYLLNNQELNG